MRRFKSVCICLLVAPALLGCADSVARRRIERLEDALADVRSFQAEQTTKIADLDTQTRSLSGRLDEIEFAQNKKLGNLDTLQSDLTTLRRRVPPPAIVPAQALEDDESLAQKMPQEISGPFYMGLQALREGNFKRASDALEEALYLGGATEYGSALLFWTGVAYEGGGNLSKAVAIYHDLVRRFPRYDRAPVALLRQASALIRLGDKQTAKIALNKLIKDYPKSSEAARAKERLKDV